MHTNEQLAEQLNSVIEKAHTTAVYKDATSRGLTMLMRPKGEERVCCMSSREVTRDASPQELSSMLNNVGEAPGATTVVTIPSAPVSNDQTLLDGIQTLESYISVLTAMCVYKNHPEPYNLDDKVQMGEWINTFAKYKSWIMTGGLVRDIAAYLPLQKISSFELNYHNVGPQDLHTQLLSDLFKGMQLPKEVFEQLDAILTSVNKSLQTVNPDTGGNTLNHFVSYYRFKEVEGASNLHQVCLRTIYMRIAANSWRTFDKKTKANFSCLVDEMETTMSASLVSVRLKTISQTIMDLTSCTPTEILTKINAMGVKQ